jgi:hypothetical protein
MLYRGYKFALLQEGFVMHVPHPHSKTHDAFYKDRDQDEWKRYSLFTEWLHKFASTTDAMIKQVPSHEGDPFCYEKEGEDFASLS